MIIHGVLGAGVFLLTAVIVVASAIGTTMHPRTLLIALAGCALGFLVTGAPLVDAFLHPRFDVTGLLVALAAIAAAWAAWTWTRHYTKGARRG